MVDGLLQALRRPDHRLAAPAPAPAGFDHHRIAQALGLRPHLIRLCFPETNAGMFGHRKTGLSCHAQHLDLMAHYVQHLKWRADKAYAGPVAGGDKIFALCQEAVSRVDGVCAMFLGDAQNFRLVCIIGCRTKLHALVRQAHVQRAAIVRRVQRHHLDAHFMAGAQDAHGDLPAIGDQDFFEHLTNSLTDALVGAQRRCAPTEHPEITSARCRASWEHGAHASKGSVRAPGSRHAAYRPARSHRRSARGPPPRKGC